MNSKIKNWLIMMRPWSFTAAAVPVCVGTLFAQSGGAPFLAGWFFLALLGGVLLQMATNFLNSYGDFKSGVDTLESTRSWEAVVVRGEIPAEQMYKAGVAVLAIASLIGFYFVWVRGWVILLFGLLGVLGAYGYTTGIAYKYRGWGPLMVFWLMGPLMVLPAYYIQTGRLSWGVLVAALPIGFLVTAIMHVNDLRDIPHDREAHIRTLSMILGFKRALYFYLGLFVGAFLSLALACWWRPTLLLPFLLLPSFLKKARALLRQKAAQSLDGADLWTAQFHLKFGLLMALGLWAYGFWA